MAQSLGTRTIGKEVRIASARKLRNCARRGLSIPRSVLPRCELVDLPSRRNCFAFPARDRLTLRRVIEVEDWRQERRPRPIVRGPNALSHKPSRETEIGCHNRQCASIPCRLSLSPQLQVPAGHATPTVRKCRCDSCPATSGGERRLHRGCRSGRRRYRHSPVCHTRQAPKSRWDQKTKIGEQSCRIALFLE